MDIEVGEYIRTLDGFIDKVIVEYKGKCNNPNCYEKHISCETDYYCEKEIVKHSKNIIDLIEVGDYVNGEPVERIETGLDWGREIATTTQYLTNEEDIETVVTKEQFENIEYKVGD